MYDIVLMCYYVNLDLSSRPFCALGRLRDDCDDAEYLSESNGSSLALVRR